MLADLYYLPGIGTFGIRIDREAHFLAFTNAADIGLVHTDLQVNFTKILRNGEKHRGLQAGRHRLARIDISIDHDPVDRRTDDRVVEFGLSLSQSGRAGQDLGLGGADLGPLSLLLC